MSRMHSRRTYRLSQYWVSLVLLGFAFFLFVSRFPFHSPVPAALSVPARFTDTAPIRHPDAQPDYQAGVYTYRCNDCHAIIPPPKSDQGRTVIQHQEIHLEHGINTACLNCHDPTNRDMFAGSVGVEIPWDQPQLLCAKCHGPVYRDWQHGSHGRINGYWDPSRGTQVRRKCIECHDPHRPPFPPLEPAPGPHTLRMGNHEEAAHSGQNNPLQLGGPSGHVEASDVSNEGP